MNASFVNPNYAPISLNLTSIVSFLFSLVDISTFIVFVWSPIEGKERGNLYRGKRWQTFCSIEYKTTFQSQPFHHSLSVSTKASVLFWNYLDVRFGLLLICRKKHVFSRSFGAKPPCQDVFKQDKRIYFHRNQSIQHHEVKVFFDFEHPGSIKVGEIILILAGFWASLIQSVNWVTIASIK